MPKYLKGLPTPILVPASMYNMEIIVDSISITLPVKGKYSELYPDYNTNDSDDEFNCVTKNDDGVFVINFNSLVSLMFAESKYPRLEDGTFFPIGDISVDMNNNTLEILGAILKFEEVI
jgi:hypothetical protein